MYAKSKVKLLLSWKSLKRYLLLFNLTCIICSICPPLHTVFYFLYWIPLKPPQSLWLYHIQVKGKMWVITGYIFRDLLCRKLSLKVFMIYLNWEARLPAKTPHTFTRRVFKNPGLWAQAFLGRRQHCDELLQPAAQSILIKKIKKEETPSVEASFTAAVKLTCIWARTTSTDSVLPYSFVILSTLRLDKSLC